MDTMAKPLFDYDPFACRMLLGLLVLEEVMDIVQRPSCSSILEHV